MNLFIYFFCISDRYKTEEICDKIISDDSFSLRYLPEQYKAQQLCDETADDFLPTLDVVPDWFVTSKVIKKLFTTLYADENILMKILVMLFLIVMKWVFLTKILTALTLTIIILMKMILVLLFMSEIWLGILNLKNTKHIKKI